MTGGVVLVLGGIGRNLAAGMSGGELYLLGDDPCWRSSLGPSSLRIEPLQNDRDRMLVERLLRNHAHYTGSTRALDSCHAGRRLPTFS